MNGIIEKIVNRYQRVKGAQKMLEFLEKQLKEMKKNAQKIKIKATGRTGISKSSENKKTVKKAGKEELETAKNSIIDVSIGLQESVKGQFGTQVTESLIQQKKILEGF